MKLTTCLLIIVCGCGAVALGEASARGAAPQPAAAPTQNLTLPAGTTMMVRLADNISSQDNSGALFSTSLETDLRVGNAVAVKKGSTIYGRIQSSTQAGRVAGQSTLELTLTQIDVNGQAVPIMTNAYQEAGQRSGRKAARGAAAGAIIGGIAGNAGTGAAIGAASGAAMRGETINLTTGTLLEFRLTQPVTVPSAQ